MSIVGTMKRKREAAQPGLTAGERLKRSKLTSNPDIWTSPWGWVGTDVFDASLITNDHLLATCGFLPNSGHTLCANKLKKSLEKRPNTTGQTPPAEHDDVIVISEDETPSCSKRSCRKNPNCVNYLGQEKWVDADEAFDLYSTAAGLGGDPRQWEKKPGVPVGLKNLGATCYANATLQVWFQDVRFRNGVYRCQASQEPEDGSKETVSVFHLQATFAALQESKKFWYNPVHFINSLEVPHEVQQDAAEFSKLFTGLLETVFHKQTDPALQTLLAQQFQGEFVYKRTCPVCNTSTTSNQTFLELDVTLENNASLESRLRATSTTEGWPCPRCKENRDAVERTVLRRVPPVLHISLMRFAWDMSTGDRKKVKHSIAFPTSIDMAHFVEPDPEKPSDAPSSDIYDLRAILLHKGASTYHGHYISHVREASTDTWFEFDDDTVTKIRPPGSDNVPVRTNAAKKRKVQRIEDSDDEDEIRIVDPPPKPDQTSKGKDSKDPVVPGARIVKSKDAYMLVYARRGDKQPEPEAPSREALEAITAVNEAHDGRVAKYKEKFEKLKAEFDAQRDKMLDVFRTWNITNARQPSAVVSQHALEEFVSRSLRKPDVKKEAKKIEEETPADDKAASEPPLEDTSALAEASTDADVKSSTDSPPPNVEPGDISVAEILCEHGKLDPSKCGEMKRISTDAYETMKQSLGVRFVPELTHEDVCEVCVKESFPERLYQRQHPKDVAAVESEHYDLNSIQYWISKDWYKDWKQTKPKMHLAGLPDPSPSDGKYHGDVFCQHGGLQANLNKRQRISPSAYDLLRGLFPGWTTLKADEPQCPVCDAISDRERVHKQEQKQLAEKESSQLGYMKGNAANGNTATLEGVPLAVVPREFVDNWKKWLLRPNGHPRPTRIDTSGYQCKHGKLNFDPSKGDMDSTMCVIRKGDWTHLEKWYSTGPLMSYTRRTVNGETIFVCTPEVCEECRTVRKSTYEVASVTVRVLADGDPTPTPGAPSTSAVSAPDGQTKLTTYASSSRQSKRLRQGGKRVERTMQITKDMSVKDIKLAVQEELRIHVICQRLFYEGRELEDNATTVAEIGILAGSTLELIEVKEDDSIMDDDGPPSKRRREEGPAFGGTLLGGGGGSRADIASSASREPSEGVLGDMPSELPPFELPPSRDSTTLADSASERAISIPPEAVPKGVEDVSLYCPTCTYLNEPTAIVCTMCDHKIDK